MVNHNPLKVLLVFALASSLAWMLRARSVLLQFKKDFKREKRKDDQGLFDKDRILTISQDGLNVSFGNTQNQYTWDQVEKVGYDKKFLYIILKGVLHHVIPLSAFANEKEPHIFFEKIESYRKS